MKNYIFVLLLVSLKTNASIYHLISDVDYKVRVINGSLYEPSLESEGFTHAATVTQVVPVANRHYKRFAKVLLLQIEEDLLTYPLKYEYVDRHNEYYPHIYGPINLSAVIKIYEMVKDKDGNFLLPDELTK